MNRTLKDVQEAEGCETNVDAVNEHTETCDIYTPGSLKARLRTLPFTEGCVVHIALASETKGHELETEMIRSLD